MRIPCSWQSTLSCFCCACHVDGGGHQGNQCAVPVGMAGLKMRPQSHCEATQTALAPLLPLLYLLLWTTSKKEKSPMGMEGKVTKQEDDVCWQPKED